MADLTTYFGANANLDTATKTLTIDLSDFESEGLDTSDVANLVVTKIFAAIILKTHNNTLNLADDPTVGVTIDAPFQSVIDRGEVSQAQWSYTVNIYAPNQNNTTPDPDDIV